jgi:regulator of sirC expression with transglutaminase-like and TPR domain
MRLRPAKGPFRKYGTRMSERVFVHPTEARRRFEEFAMRELSTDDLLEGSLLIALEEYPKLDFDHYRGRIDELVERVLEKCSPGEPGIFRLGHVHSVLFDEENFIGNVGSYYDERNSFMNEVIDRKLGIPISLSILFLTVARRIGLDAYGVGLPGHFLSKVQFELSEVYVDSFYGGQTMTVQEIAEFLAEISSGEVALRSDHLRAWEPRQILARMLANLHQIYEQRGDRRRAMGAAERIEILGTSPRSVS